MVVEAAETGGASITASLALDYGRSVFGRIAHTLRGEKLERYRMELTRLATSLVQRELEEVRIAPSQPDMGKEWINPS